MAKNTQEETVKEPAVEIIRGRMPLAIVYLIKFQSTPEDTDGALARKYRTTNGKISDIRKGRNFGYITKDFKPSAEHIEAAQDYAAQCGDEVVAELNSMEVATAEEAQAFAESRKGSRGGRKAAAAVQEVENDSIDELLE